jgi:hypothetical protein
MQYVVIIAFALILSFYFNAIALDSAPSTALRVNSGGRGWEAQKTACRALPLRAEGEAVSAPSDKRFDIPAPAKGPLAMTYCVLISKQAALYIK